MNSRRTIYVVVLVAGLVAAPNCLAEGWKMPNLNPFSKTSAEKNRATANFSDQAKSGGLPKFSLPSWPGTAKSTAPRSGQPSTMQKLSRNTKTFFVKTKQVLMPWSSPQKPTGSRTAKKKSFFSSWLPKSKPETQPPKTVSDFLGQDRPGF